MGGFIVRKLNKKKKKKLPTTFEDMADQGMDMIFNVPK